MRKFKAHLKLDPSGTRSSCQTALRARWAQLQTEVFCLQLQELKPFNKPNRTDLDQTLSPCFHGSELKEGNTSSFHFLFVNHDQISLIKENKHRPILFFLRIQDQLQFFCTSRFF